MYKFFTGIKPNIKTTSVFINQMWKVSLLYVSVNAWLTTLALRNLSKQNWSSSTTTNKQNSKTATTALFCVFAIWLKVELAFCSNSKALCSTWYILCKIKWSDNIYPKMMNNTKVVLRKNNPNSHCTTYCNFNKIFSWNCEWRDIHVIY